jgi:uncharacterized protein (TIGR02118 family)
LEPIVKNLRNALLLLVAQLLLVSGAFAQVKMTLMYNQPKDAEAFEEHYSKVHMPLILATKGIQKVETSLVQKKPDGTLAPYHRIFEAWFDGPSQMQAVFQSAEWQAVRADFQGFAKEGALVLFSDLKK